MLFKQKTGGMRAVIHREQSGALSVFNPLTYKNLVRATISVNPKVKMETRSQSFSRYVHVPKDLALRFCLPLFHVNDGVA